ncbi:TetR family transcriptional regulator [Nonomuraea roseoviolacea]|uniref:AcrR family transcriptional regulator n=1 Tax=Nonomuraea roseoviolacea subsp. carminata TaxID=160689 RepID=A0ABT1KDE0_9ACTN|nr:TetR family transcriptional regulator [Nonomuraea roseoviolacea]MCP2352043.1 AcrR family transcriptional regulator [Nonomuraea roseoviolacea subsp. carminata]
MATVSWFRTRRKRADGRTMARLSRAELQRLNRSKVVEAARGEFAERGFGGATIDGIAGRAGLTRGAVYSNFPGKRALYFTVLAELSRAAETGPGAAARARTAREALGGFARAWVTRLPLVSGDPGDPAGEGRLPVDLMPEVLADERLRAVVSGLRRLDALLLGLALERMDALAPERGGLRAREAAAEGQAGAGAAGSGRRVRVAEAALTTLRGASELAVAAPGFVEPFDLVAVGEELAGLDLDDRWAPPPVVPPVQPADAPWPAGALGPGGDVSWPGSEPGGVRAADGEAGSARGGGLGAEGVGAEDGVVAVLGLLEAGAAEEAVRAAPPGVPVTVALAGGDPAEQAPLTRLWLADVTRCLREAFPPRAWPLLRVAYDDTGALAAAAGVPAATDDTIAAVRVRDGRIVARADGPGACHAIASSVRLATV